MKDLGVSNHFNIILVILIPTLAMIFLLMINLELKMFTMSREEINLSIHKKISMLNQNMETLIKEEIQMFGIPLHNKQNNREIMVAERWD